MPYYNMKCRLCGGYVGQQFFEDENIPEDDPRMIGPALCGHHEFSDPVPESPPPFSPNHGAIGASVTLFGRNMDTDVFFNGIAAENPRMDNGNLVVDIPSGATSGYLEIKPPNMDVGPLDLFTVEE